MIGFVKRKATTKARTFAAVKLPWTDQEAVKDGKLPPELVINWDQTVVNLLIF